MARLEKITFGNWALLGADGMRICDYEGILEVIRASSSQVITEPIEGGELAAFNKVQQPDAVRVTLSMGGDPAEQSAALERLKRLKKGTGSDYLCMLVSPADVVDSLALESIGQSHSAQNGATLLVVELSFIRIRAVQTTTAKVQWTPARATSAEPVNAGRTQSYAYKNLLGSSA